MAQDLRDVFQVMPEIAPPMYTWHVTHGAASDIGLSRHQAKTVFIPDPQPACSLYCLRRHGRHRAGEVASSRTIALIPQHIAAATTADPTLPLVGRSCHDCSVATNRLASAVRVANHQVYQEATHDQPYAGMGTTVVAGVARGVDPLSCAHVGDSRLYLIRNKTIRLLTRGPFLVQEQVRSGLLTDAKKKPARGAQTCADPRGRGSRPWWMWNCRGGPF